MPNINWREDLDQLADELPKLHKNLFFNQGKKQFYAYINALKERVNDMNSYTIVMEIARIVASLGDAHTAVALSRYNRLPFDCYWFQEGIFITAVLPVFQDLLHCKLVKINGMPMERVVERLTGIISHENQSFLRSQLPDYLICADILFGLAIANRVDHVKLTVENHDKEQRELVIPTIKYADGQEDALHEKICLPAETPLYRKNKKQYFWSAFDPVKKLLYVNYNKCKDMADITVHEFSDQLIKDITGNFDIQKIVIDLRNNGGGNSELFQDYLQWLSNFDRLNCPGRIFVIVGRDTFSSALLNAYYLKFNTQALFLGEPTGGKPNCYGEVKYFSLHNSGLYIRYSTKYYELVDDNDLPSLMPDVICNVTFNDYLENIDPCMEWIYEESVECG